MAAPTTVPEAFSSFTPLPAIGDSDASKRPLLFASRKTKPLIVGHESSRTVSSDSILGADLWRPPRPSLRAPRSVARLFGRNGIDPATTEVKRSSDSSSVDSGAEPLRLAYCRVGGSSAHSTVKLGTEDHPGSSTVSTSSRTAASGNRPTPGGSGAKTTSAAPASGSKTGSAAKPSAAKTILDRVTAAASDLPNAAVTASKRLPHRSSLTRSAPSTIVNR